MKDEHRGYMDELTSMHKGLPVACSRCWQIMVVSASFPIPLASSPAWTIEQWENLLQENDEYALFKCSVQLFGIVYIHFVKHTHTHTTITAETQVTLVNFCYLSNSRELKENTFSFFAQALVCYHSHRKVTDTGLCQESLTVHLISVSLCSLVSVLPHGTK